MSKTPLVKSMVQPDDKNRNAAVKIVSGKVLQPGATIQEEVKRIMSQKGIDLDLLIERYKIILTSLPDKVNASDVLKAGDTLLRLWGVQTQDDQTVLKVGAMFQSKSTDELKSFVVELSTRTQAYLGKMREPVQDTP